MRSPQTLLYTTVDFTNTVHLRYTKFILKYLLSSTIIESCAVMSYDHILIVFHILNVLLTKNLHEESLFRHSFSE